MTVFGDDGSRVEAVGFDYDLVDEHLAADRAVSRAILPFESPASSHPEALTAIQTIANWIVQKVPRNSNGLEIRSTLVAWKFCPHLRGYSLTEMAALIGRDKQSLGRWNDDWNRTFGTRIVNRFKRR